MTAIYVDVDDFKNSLSLAGTTFMDSDAEAACIAASAGIDEAQGRTYGKSEVDEIRFFVPDDPELIWIDDLAEITTLRVDSGDGTYDTWTLGTDFRLEPLNAEGKGRPFTSARAKSNRFPVWRLALV